MKEFDLIEKLERRFRRPSRSVEIGIGDDAAVVSAGGGMRWAVTTDAMVEGVHFDSTLGTPHQLGRKALAVNLSDLAAMGAEPRHALIALGLTENLEEPFVDALFDGLDEMGREHRVSIIGGNITRSPVFSINVTALGSLPGPALERGGGKPGDVLLVTGSVGSSALGLQLLRDGREDLDDDEKALLRRHLDPTPRVAVGEALRLMATAGIDISDGLAQDAGHLADASRCGARIELVKLPLSPAYEKLTANLEDRWLPALAGGEDYELLLSVPKALVATAQQTAVGVGCMLHEIGELVATQGVLVIDEDGRSREAPRGWEHL